MPSEWGPDVPRNLQTRVTGDTATETPGARTTGLYGGAVARLQGYLGLRESGRLSALTGAVAYLSALEASDLLTASSVAGPIDAEAIPTDKYRQQQPLLFQRAHTLKTRLTYTNRSGTLIDTGLDHYNNGVTNSYYRFGPTNELVCGNDMWPWANAGGDYIDANGVQQGSTPFSTLAIASGSLPNAPSTHNINVKTLLERVASEDRWLAVFLKVSGSANIYLKGSLEADNTRIDITYTDTTTETLNAWVIAGLTSGYTTAMDAETFITSTKAGVFEFYPRAHPEKTIATATMVLQATRAVAVSGTTTLSAFIVAPPLPDLTAIPGAAASHPMDAAIETMTGYVTHMPLVTDSTVIDDVLDTARSQYSYSEPYIPGNPPATTQHAEAEFDPELWTTEANKADIGLATWPTPLQQANLLPTRNVGRWVGKTSQDRFSVVHSDDSAAIADGFEPLAPGLGAVQITMPSDNLETGQLWLDGITASMQDVKLYLPKDKIGRVNDLYLRFYVRLGTGWEPSADDDKWHINGGSMGLVGLYPDEAGVTPTMGNAVRTNRMGKWFGGAAQQTRETMWRGYVDPTRVAGSTELIESVQGGNSETGGAAGHSGRFWFRQGVMDPTLPGPAKGGLVPIFGPQDYRSPDHSIEELRGQMLNWSTSWETASTRFGGLGHLYPFKWYCFEWRFKANTIVPYTLPAVGVHYMNAGYLVDGKVEFWVDGVKAGMSPDWAFRTGRMIEWSLQTAASKPFGSSGAMRAMTNVPDADYLGFAHLIGDPYYGGKTPNPRRKVWWINALVVAENYIGPMYGLSRANGGLGSVSGSNTWIQTAGVGEWGVIPGNTASAVNPDNDPTANPNYPAAAPWRVTGGHSGLMAAWCGMCFDQAGGVAWVPNGEGHNDGWSNAIYKWQLDQATPAWVRVKNPSVVANYADGAVASGVYSDGRPRALHTYNYTEYIPGYGPAVCNEIALANTGGSGPGRLYLIDEVTGDHTFRAASTPAGGSGAATCYDSTRGVVWMRVNGTQPMRYWTPATNTWTSVGATIAWAGASSLCYMPDTDCILIGNGENELGQTVSGGWCVFDCSTGAYYYPTFTGAPALNVAQSGGLWPGKCQPAWDSVRRCAYAWDQDSGSTTSILRLTPGTNPRSDAWTLDVVTVAPTNTVTPSAAQATGTYGRAFYWAAKQVFIVVNDVAQNGYFFRIG